MTKFFLLLLTCTINLSQLFSNDNIFTHAKTETYLLKNDDFIEDKLYIHPEQIHINNDAMFINVKDRYFLIRQLNHDENGFYVLRNFLEDKISDTCFNGHKIWCWRCVGCVVRYCKFRCKCVEWEKVE